MKTERQITAKITELERRLSELKQRRKEMDFALFIQQEGLLEREITALKWVLEE